ncbi:rCG42280 [Rattus norvegicus]|uniref:RCG42280 n=1 Tax=Rattus norvegicus TaxID=10116 RepID=A6KFT8_RAT|nr:rCG42280 [Rattus norvegicus]
MGCVHGAAVSGMETTHRAYPAIWTSLVLPHLSVQPASEDTNANPFIGPVPGWMHGVFGGKMVPLVCFCRGRTSDSSRLESHFLATVSSASQNTWAGSCSAPHPMSGAETHVTSVTLPIKYSTTSPKLHPGIHPSTHGL